MVSVRQLIESNLQEGRHATLVFGEGLPPNGYMALDIEDFVFKAQRSGKFDFIDNQDFFADSLAKGFVYVTSPDGSDVIVWSENLPVTLSPSGLKRVESVFGINGESVVLYRGGPDDHGQRRDLETLFHPEKSTTAPGEGADEEKPAVAKPYLGFKMENVGGQQGIRVTDVVPGSPAARSGLKAGDIISSVLFTPRNISNVKSTKEYRMVETKGLKWVVDNIKPGDPIRLGVNRGSGWVKLNLVAAKPPKEAVEEAITATKVADLVRRSGKKPETVCRMLDIMGVDAPDYESQPPELISKTGWTKPSVK